MKLPAGPSCALDDDDAASLEASLLEDVAPPEREKEDNTVAILCAAGAAVGALVFGYSLGFSSPALPGMLGRQFKHVRCDANGASAAAASMIVADGGGASTASSARLLNAASTHVRSAHPIPPSS